MSDELAAAYHTGRHDERQKDKQALRNALRERNEALEKNTELGKMYLDAVNASQGHEMEAAMLQAERDAARAQVAALQDALREVHDLPDEAHISRARSIAGSALIHSEALALVEDT